MPKNCIADGSVAILTTIDDTTISEEDLAYYATDEFSKSTVSPAIAVLALSTLITTPYFSLEN